MPPVFSTGEIRVFDKAGAPLGSLTKWSVVQPRSYRFNEIEDFTFSLPRNDLATGTTILTSTVCNTYLRRDNLIYVQNRDSSMRGWAGRITNVQYGSGRAIVRVAGLGECFHKLETGRIEQDNGYVWTIAQRFVLAAQAKQVANNDFVVGFQHDETPGAERRNYGRYSYEGDIFAGLQTLAGSTLSEFFIHAHVLPSGYLQATVRWGGRWHIDHRDIVLSDGPGGVLLPDNDVSFISTDVVNRARLRGAPTSLSDYVDYNSVRAIITDVVPEAELALDTGTYRRREELGLTVGFGYDEAVQRAMAQQVQDLYLGYYKSFLYAYHCQHGKPYLEGFDWPGPDGRNDKKLTAHFFRSYRALGYIGKKTVLTGSTTDDDVSFIEAEFTDWQFKQTLDLTPLYVDGMAVDPSDPGQHFIADSTTGNVYELAADGVTQTLLLHATTGATEYLISVATDPTQPSTLWVACGDTGITTVKAFNAATGVLISSWTVPLSNPIDITVDAANGIVWLARTSSGNIHALDISGGTELLTGTYRTFASGFSALAALSMSGGLMYAMDGSGNVRFLFAADGGDFAGSKATGMAATGLMVDADGGEVWVCDTSGLIHVFRAHIAVATINAPGSVEGAPGFDNIVAGQFVHVVMTSDRAASPHPRNKYAIAYSPGRYVTRVVETQPGEPDELQRQWVTGDPVFAIVKKSQVSAIGNEVVCQGEESRVDDWDPKSDGYGVFGDELLKTPNGHVVRYTKRWRQQDWDVPPRAFEIDPPEWTEGLAYLQEYLAQRNSERPVQVLRITNDGNLFRQLALGGEYTVEKTLDGPPGGLTGVIRLLAYTPDESQGTAELIGEWVE